LRLSGKTLLGLAALLVLGLSWQRHVMDVMEGARQSENQTNLNLDVTSLFANKPENSTLPLSTSPAEDTSPSPDTLEANIQNAQALIDRGLIKEATSMLEKIIEAQPSDTQALMEMAMVYTLDLKEPQKSRELLERILDINPQHRAALNELELLYKELDAVEDGLALLAEKSEQHPESLEIQFVYGRLLAEMDPKAAIPWLQRATLISDQKEQALDQLATAAFRAGELTLAVKSWREALSIAESELELAKSNGASGIDYLEDRIIATRMELAKAQETLKRSHAH